MLVMTAISGETLGARSMMCPRPLLPTSRISDEAPSGMLRTVSGTPISLLNDLGAAWARSPRAPATRSFVVVFPLLPVIAITGTSIS